MIVVVAWQFGGSATNRFDVPGTESSEAISVLEQRFPSQSGTSATVVLGSDGAPLSDTGDVVEQTVEQLERIDGVSSVIDPLSPPPGVTALSDDETVALVNVQFSTPVEDVGNEGFEQIDVALGEARDAGLQAEIGGELPQFAAAPEPGRTSEVVGVIAAVVVLLLAFASVVAMGLPIGDRGGAGGDVAAVSARPVRTEDRRPRRAGSGLRRRTRSRRPRH